MEEKVNSAFAQTDGVYVHSDNDCFLRLRLMMDDFFVLHGYKGAEEIGVSVVSLDQLRSMCGDDTHSFNNFTLEVHKVIASIGDKPVSNKALRFQFFESGKPVESIVVIREVFAQAMQLASNQSPKIPFSVKLLQGGMLNIALTTAPEKGLSVMKKMEDVESWVVMPISTDNKSEGSLYNVVRMDAETLRLTFISRGGGLYPRDMNISDFKLLLAMFKERKQ